MAIFAACARWHSWRVYASYYYARDPDLINTVPAQDISVVQDKDGRDPRC
jgi:hypothetical protein